MDFRLLGPLEVRAGGAVVALGSPKHRILLAALLLNHDRMVHTAELAEAIWGDGQPGNPRRAIQLYVTRLRGLLVGMAAAPIVTGADGYRLDVAPDETDLGRFRQWVVEADRAAERGDLDKEATALAQALGEWRGEPLADVPSDLLQREAVPHLREQRLRTVERRVDIDLKRGRHAELVGELRALTAQYPLRERMWAQLMAALDGDGRRAEALSAYHEARRCLVEALGVEPGEEIQERYSVILHRRVSSSGSAGSPPVPRQLPPDVRGFAGRKAELAELDALAAGAEGALSGTVVISAIAGTAGVGKTALAVHWARRVADEFPDGQLWVNLRGYDPGQSLAPEQALTLFLRALGVPEGRIPLDLDGLSGMFRSLLDGRRMLVVLDNANGPEQVRPLLPGAPGSLVVVTSRDDLAGLVARDGAARLRLDLLSQREAVGLLRRLLGDAAVEDAAVRELARLCARLPLALRIAAERVILGRGRLSRVVEELTGARPLDGLAAGGDPYTALRSVFSWSYRALPPQAAGLFRWLGLVPGADWDAHAASALAGTPLADAQRLLGVLVSAHLVEERGGDRYGMHDLLRAYAAELADEVDEEAVRHAALTRLFDFYLGTASKAMDVVYPFEKHLRPAVAAPVTPVPDVADARGAMAWLDTERANLTAVVLHGWPDYAPRLAHTLGRYLTVRAAHAEAMAIHGHALRVAVQTGDRAGEATAGFHLGRVHWALGRYAEAQDVYQRALTIYREAGDRLGEAMTLSSLGTVDSVLGNNNDALERFEQAAAIMGEIGDRAQEARVLNNLGIANVSLGRDGEALAHYERGLAIAREVGDWTNEANLLNSIGFIHNRRGDSDLAYEHCRQALELSREVGDRNFEVKSLGAIGAIYAAWGRYEAAHETLQEVLVLVREIGDPLREADVWSDLGSLHLRRGRHGEAVDAFRRALELAREVGFRPVEVLALIGLGDAARAASRPAEALEHHAAALDLARDSGDPHLQARALDGLGDAHCDLGDLVSAQQAWHAALARYTKLGAPEAEAVQAKLIEDAPGMVTKTGG